MFFFFQAEDGIRDLTVTGVQTCALPISPAAASSSTNITYASCAAVLILLIAVGRPRNGPNHRRKVNAPSPISTSRATTAAVSHHGTSPSHAHSTNTVTSSSLSAVGSRILPSSEVQLKRFAR